MFEIIDDLWRMTPTWAKILMVMWIGIGIAATIYAFQTCGLKALLFGQSAVLVAAIGGCG